mmetsp:Transcript_9837/g.24338  ORF Transcript_9837/g.24338 Transcript_9837/m.24338 type:complete len:138 (-) Transcript_9837:16-429(-)|eukprot:CAMPEP_0182823050 /NCGR_PEP_ID=MMETSP0006_2-20121128/14538_1 /TAXON_ID=97485 /ORGANISM="Prymnesium parvum, Strain Texoma1" /LENGTH=137 /DNA_ID=CAMNT_0024949931 /DNA_START=20 /DNA_END=433 /DNA_ORIENTATION=+
MDSQGAPSATPYVAMEQPAIRVDWKASFSSERTFMAWVHMAITLLGVGLGLAASGWPGARTSAAILLVPAALFLAWSLVSFYRRLHALDQKIVPGIVDKTAPTFALAVMILAILGNLASSWYRLWLSYQGDEEAYEP